MKDGADTALVIIMPMSEQLITLGLIDGFSSERLKFLSSLLQFDKAKSDH